MTTKIVAIDEQRAVALDSCTDFHSVRLGRAVVIDIPECHNHVPGLITESLGFTDEVTDYDRSALYS